MQAGLSPVYTGSVDIFNCANLVQNKFFKVYNDGSHYVGFVPTHRVTRFSLEQKQKKTEVDMLFDSLYLEGLKNGLSRSNLRKFIQNGILCRFPDIDDLDEYIPAKMERKSNNFYKRKKRFRRKAYLNNWNYFITITYDSAKHDEYTFRKKLRRCLSNLKVRRGWKYIGVFERGGENDRLHFHAVVYVPDGEMLGKLVEVRDYDIYTHQMQNTIQNTFFGKKFGRSDFEPVDMNELKFRNRFDYLLKYLQKSGEKLVYGRGVPAEIYIELDENKVAMQFIDFVVKVILFDNVIDWERDVARYKPKQMSIYDLMNKRG